MLSGIEIWCESEEGKILKELNITIKLIILNVNFWDFNKNLNKINVQILPNALFYE